MDARTIAAMQARASARLVAQSQALAEQIEIPRHILAAIQTQRGTPLERQVLQLNAVCDLLDVVIAHVGPDDAADG